MANCQWYKVNGEIVDGKFSLTLNTELLYKLGQYFTTVAFGFHQIEIEREDIPKTASLNWIPNTIYGECISVWRTIQIHFKGNLYITYYVDLTKKVFIVYHDFNVDHLLIRTTKFERGNSVD